MLSQCCLGPPAGDLTPKFTALIDQHLRADRVRRVTLNINQGD